MSRRNDLIAERDRVWQATKDILDAAGDQALTTEQRSAYDAASTRIDEIDEEIRNIMGEETANVDTAIITGQPRTAVRYGVPMGREERFADLLGGAYDGTDLGDHVRALYRGEVRANEGTPSAGGYLVPTPLAANVLDLARAQAAVFRAGALTVPMDAATLKVAKLLTDPSPAWRSEAAAIAESDATFGQVTFTAQSLAVLVKVSNELIEDAPNFGAELTSVLAQAFALKLDHAALYGSGTAPEPKGLTHASWGVPTTQLGTPGTGATATYADMIAATAAVRGANYEPTAAVMRPEIEAGFTVAGSDGHWVEKPAYVSYPFISTTGVTASSGKSSVFIGDFANLLIGMRSSFTVKTLNERFADTGQVGIVAALRADVQVARSEAFRILLEAK